jgi:hypothetical protein
VSLRQQRAHNVTGKGSLYFGQAQIRLLTMEQQIALSAIRDRARRAATRRKSRAKAAPAKNTRGTTARAKGSDFRRPTTPMQRKIKQLVGIESRKIFHMSDCPWAPAFPLSRLGRQFESRREALRAGYRECKTCRP